MVAEGMLFTLVIGAYGYTFLVDRKTGADKLASKEDVTRLEERIDTLYEHLLNRPMPLPKNGDRK